MEVEKDIKRDKRDTGKRREKRKGTVDQILTLRLFKNATARYPMETRQWLNFQSRESQLIRHLVLHPLPAFVELRSEGFSKLKVGDNLFLAVRNGDKEMLNRLKLAGIEEAEHFLRWANKTPIPPSFYCLYIDAVLGTASQVLTIAARYLRGSWGVIKDENKAREWERFAIAIGVSVLKSECRGSQ